MDPFLEPSPASRKEKKLLDHMREVMHVKHYSLRTERTYCDWVERFIRFHLHPCTEKAGSQGQKPLD
jgi:hypothetical protein